MFGRDKDRFESWRELRRSEIKHLEAPFGIALAEDAAFGLELPYQSLGGEGFERLCYHVLVSEGKVPRFYGAPGQAQYGVDLIVSNGSDCDVFQCKNVIGFDANALKSALDVFEKRWKSPNPGFPIPESFTICITEKIRERKEWEAIKTDFHNRTGVRVSEWDRTYLDTKLKGLPDTVADLFGDVVADRFCDGRSWNDGLWVRLLPGMSPETDRYLALEAEKQLVLNDKLIEPFNDIQSRGETTLIEGESGVGKSIAGLALAWATRRRVMYIDLKPDVSVNDLFLGISSRIARDTVFVIDNCHQNWDIVATATERVKRAMGRRPYTLIQIGQTSPKGAEMVDIGAVDYVEQLREQKSAIRIEPDQDNFRKVVRATLPAEQAITDRQIAAMYDLTAGNLALLNIVLQSGILPDRSDATFELFANELAKAWFKTEFPTASELHAFSSIAQFELTIPAEATWPEPEATRYPAAINRFVLRKGGIPGRSGPTWQFVHPRQAELVCRVLSVVSGQDWQVLAVRNICDHLLDMSGDTEALFQVMSQFFRRRLTLADDKFLKIAVVSEPRILAFISNNIENTPLPILSLVTMFAQGTESAAIFVPLLSRKLQLVLETTETQQGGQIGLLGLALRSLAIVDEGELEVLLSSVGTDHILEVIVRHGTLFELFRTLQYSSPDFAAGLITALDETIVGELINKTIVEGRSIGTLHLTLRDLADRPLPGGGTQLQALETHLGGAPMLRLIRANGTLFELFRTLGHSSPDFAAGLITALDETIVGELIDKTIAEGRSIGTLNYTLRVLARRPWPEGKDQRWALESLISAPDFWRLIRANGNLNDLAYLLGDASREFLGKLFEPGAAPDVEQWRDLLKSSSFYDLARFYADSFDQLPLSVLLPFHTAVTIDTDLLTQRSSWYELSTGLSRLARRDEELIPEAMSAAVSNRAARCNFDSIVGLNFIEAINSVRIIWDHAPERHQEIAERIWDILPAPEAWPRDYNLLNTGGLLFGIMSEAAFSEDSVLRMVTMFWPDLPLEAAELASGNVMSLFLWRLQGCLELRKGQRDLPLPRAITAEAKELLLNRLGHLASKAKSNRDKLGTLSFAGAMAYFWPELRADIDAAVRGRVRGFPFLLDNALTLRFVPAAFASIGLTFIGPARKVFSPDRTTKLCKLLEDYDEVTDQGLALEAYLHGQTRPGN